MSNHNDTPRQFSSNKEYNLYDLYTDSERVYKTDWSNLDNEQQLERLKRLHDEGFAVIPKNFALEEPEAEFKKRFTEQVNSGTIDNIPINKEVLKTDPSPNKKQLNIHQERRKETKPPKTRNVQRTDPRTYSEPEQMTMEEQKPKFSVKNMVNYLKAEQSLATQGPVSLKVYEERKKICGECPHRKMHDKVPDPLGFCTKCGCGANPRARLTNKIKMPQTSCPLGKWDTSTGIYKGVVGKLRHKLTSKSKREKLDYT